MNLPVVLFTNNLSNFFHTMPFFTNFGQVVMKHVKPSSCLKPCSMKNSLISDSLTGFISSNNKFFLMISALEFWEVV